jgi:hypothetical protein
MSPDSPSSPPLARPPQILMDADARAAYNAQLESALADEEDGYKGQPLSKWMPELKPAMAKNADPAENRAVFVDGGWGGGGGPR